MSMSLLMRRATFVHLSMFVSISLLGQVNSYVRRSLSQAEKDPFSEESLITQILGISLTPTGIRKDYDLIDVIQSEASVWNGLQRIPFVSPVPDGRTDSTLADSRPGKAKELVQEFLESTRRSGFVPRPRHAAVPFRMAGGGSGAMQMGG